MYGVQTMVNAAGSEIKGIIDCDTIFLVPTLEMVRTEVEKISSVDKISREEKATVNHIQMKRWTNGGTIFYCSEWNPRLGACICKSEYVDDIKKCGNNPTLKAKPPVVPKTDDDAGATPPQPPPRKSAKGGTLRKKTIQKNKNIYKTLGKKLSLNPSLKKKIIKKYRKQLSYKKKYHDLKKQLTNLLD